MEILYIHFTTDVGDSTVFDDYFSPAEVECELRMLPKPKKEYTFVEKDEGWECTFTAEILTFNDVDPKFIQWIKSAYEEGFDDDDRTFRVLK